MAKNNWNDVIYYSDTVTVCLNRRKDVWNAVDLMTDLDSTKSKCLNLL